ncbi:hypothetical protein CFC21_096141 [Triticum aestivum]|uniref:Uncharacterized protein n=3 Tax=Triticum TaxID=4564 RepID=A0A9R1BJE0_TRITD|nr:hypothetical protein CFC21_096141 [Triticum aestivum]VAI70455.1 unnamed protein product [Triticum turgidum subsp. durum]
MAWFASLALLGALHVAALVFPLLSHLALCLHRHKDLRRRYGAWAVVTGPTSGMGRSTALELARRGLNLVLVGRNPAKLREVSAAISKAAPAVQSPDQDRRVRPVARLHRSGGRGDAAAAADRGGAGRRRAGEQRRGARGPHGVPARGRRGGVGGHDTGELAGADRGDGGGDSGDGGAREGSCGELRLNASEVLPSLPIYTMYATTKHYVAWFSKCLHVEYRSKGIDVQCQAPFFVTGAMASGFSEAKLFAPLTPTPDDYARAAARWIGHGALCVPNLRHQIAWFIAYVVPDWLLEELLLREHLWQRKELQMMRPLPRAPAETRDLVSYTGTSGCLS